LEQINNFDLDVRFQLWKFGTSLNSDFTWHGSVEQISNFDLDVTFQLWKFMVAQVVMPDNAVCGQQAMA